MTHPNPPISGQHAASSTETRIDPAVYATPRADCPLLFADTETTSLTRPHLRGGRRIWDAAIIRRDPGGTENYFQGYVSIADIGLTAYMPPDLMYDTTTSLRDRLYKHVPDDIRDALDVGHFWDRHPEMTNGFGVHPNVYSERDLAAQLVSWTSAVPGGQRPYLIGSVPSFDEESFADLLRRCGFLTGDNTPWHYRPVDVVTAVATRLGAPLPWNPQDLSRRLGVDPGKYAQHTALGDARWARDMFDAAFAPQAYATGGLVQ